MAAVARCVMPTLTHRLVPTIKAIKDPWSSQDKLGALRIILTVYCILYNTSAKQVKACGCLSGGCSVCFSLCAETRLYMNLMLRARARERPGMANVLRCNSIVNPDLDTLPHQVYRVRRDSEGNLLVHSL